MSRDSDLAEIYSEFKAQLSNRARRVKSPISTSLFLQAVNVIDKLEIRIENLEDRLARIQIISDEKNYR